MRRSLKFDSLAEVTFEAERLLATGYTRSGKWSLGQVCCHMRRTMESNVNGYPLWMVVFGFPLRPILRRFALPRLLAGNSAAGIPTAGMFVPPNELVDADEVQRLKECIAAFLELKEPVHAHPGFGKMSNQDFESFHAAHAAHHLSFLRPLDAEEPNATT